MTVLIRDNSSIIIFYKKINDLRPGGAATDGSANTSEVRQNVGVHLSRRGKG